MSRVPILLSIVAGLVGVFAIDLFGVPALMVVKLLLVVAISIRAVAMALATVWLALMTVVGLAASLRLVARSQPY